MSRFHDPARCLWVVLIAALAGLAGCSDDGPSRPRLSEPPPVVVAPLDSTLDAQQALWASKGIDTYDYRFRWECYCIDSYVRVVDISVRGGVVTSVRDAQTGRDLGPEAIAQYRTIDGLFDFVREARDLPASSIRIGYDSDLGYPAAAYVDYMAQAIDDELAFRVYGLGLYKTR